MIALDAVSDSGIVSLTDTFSWAHTVAGTDRVLIVGLGLRIRTGTSGVVADAVKSITYNGQVLTRIRNDSDGDLFMRSELWLLVAPPEGTADIVVTLEGDNADNTMQRSGGASLIGVDQNSPIDTHVGATSTSALMLTANLTTSVEDCWLVDATAFRDSGGGAPTPGAGQTLRWGGGIGADPRGVGGSTKEAVPAGANSMSWMGSAANRCALSVVALQPSGGEPPPPPQTSTIIEMGALSDPGEGVAHKLIYLARKPIPAGAVTADGETLLLDEQPTLIHGVRVASATQTDLSTQRLIDALDDYQAHKMLGFGVFLQGSRNNYSTGYSIVGSDAVIDADNIARYQALAEAMRVRGQVLIAGCFYQHAHWPSSTTSGMIEQVLEQFVDALKPYPNVIFNPANENGSSGWTQGIDGGVAPSNIGWNFNDLAVNQAALQIIAAKAPNHLRGVGGYHIDLSTDVALLPEATAALWNTASALSGSNIAQSTADMYDAIRPALDAAGTLKPHANIEMIGGFTRTNPTFAALDSGEYTGHQSMFLAQFDEALTRPGIAGVFFHNNRWFQPDHTGEDQFNPYVPAFPRFDIAGYGNPYPDVGHRWYVEHVDQALA